MEHFFIESKRGRGKTRFDLHFEEYLCPPPPLCIRCCHGSGQFKLHRAVIGSNEIYFKRDKNLHVKKSQNECILLK